MTPIQRFLHRLVSGLPMESDEKTIRVISNADQFLFSGFTPEIDFLTEIDFYSKLVTEGRLKLDGTLSI